MISVIYIFITSICIGFIFLCYWIPNKLGYKKTGFIISSILGLLIIYISIYTIFEDELFSNRNAKELLKKQGIILNDNFDILKNESDFAIGDYYHIFILKISNKDKNKIITQIVNSNNYQKIGEKVTEINQEIDENIGFTIIQNYETENEYVRKIYKTFREEISPDYITISLEKKGNNLIFAEIDE